MNPSPRLPRFLWFALLSALVLPAAVLASGSDDGVWTSLAGDAPFDPARGRKVALRLDRLRAQLAQAPAESRGLAAGAGFQLPLPDGGFVSLRAVDAPILGAEMQRLHPGIRSFLAEGTADRRVRARLTLTPLGVSAVVFTPRGTALVEPRGTDAVSGRWLSDIEQAAIECEVIERSARAAPAGPATQAWGDRLQTMRFVLMATGEFTQALGGVPATTARMAAAINFENAFFERDVALRLVVVALHPFPNPATDPYPDDLTLLDRNTVVVDSLYGAANYDMGALLHYIGGSVTRGIGFLPTLCSEGAKAGSVVRAHDAAGVNVELTLGHELGHGLGGYHTQDRACNRSANAAYEVGSGLTILCSMPAACVPDVQPQREPYYHQSTIEFMTGTLNAHPACGATTLTGNTIPAVDAGPDVTIPRGTPFVLRGTASDPDAGDALTYTWEQHDLAPTSNDPILGPIFRWRLPTSEPVRFCPPAASVLSGVPETYEPLPPLDRTIRFRLMARDNHPGAGAVAWDEKVIVVSGSPFAVAFPNGGEVLDSALPFAVTWTVGGGSVAPTVNILVSTDGGANWTPLAPGVANDGSESVSFPVGATVGTCRIKVEAATNIFYDVSNADFTLLAGVTPALVSRLETEASAEGITLRWKFAEPVRAEDVRIERSEPGAGWTMPDGERWEEPSGSAFLDRGVLPGREYLYRLTATLLGGSTLIAGPIAATSSARPERLAIQSVAPSPAPGAIRVEYVVARTARVTLDVLDVQGRVVAVLDDRVHRAGRHHAAWNGEGGRGRVPGLYYVRVRSEGASHVRPVVVTR